MNFKVGDKVKFLDEVGGGIITGFLDEDKALVRNDDDFDIPYLLSELVHADIDVTKAKELPQDKDIYDEDIEVVETQNVVDSSYEAGNEVFLAFVEDEAYDAEDAVVQLFLINDTKDDLLYHIIYEYADCLDCVDSGKLEHETKGHIQAIPRNEINDIIQITVQYIVTSPNDYQYQSPVEVDVKVRSLKSLKRGLFLENDFFDEGAILVQLNKQSLYDSVQELDDTDVIKVIKEKKDYLFGGEKRKKKTVKSEKNALMEIDLHMHEVIDDERGMSNGEKLLLQIAHFRKELEGAMTSNVKRIVFIHGVGNGVLKHELRKILDNEYYQLKYQDASFKEYGYGATMVLI